MAYPIARKFVVAVASNALFDLSKEDKIFREKGLEEYRKYQTRNKNKILKPGLAFPFIKRFLNINIAYAKEKPVEVVLLSRNSPETGIRIFNSIANYNLDITRAAFTSGQPPYKYIPAFNVSLFLSTNINDVKNAIEAKYPAGYFINTSLQTEEDENELRVAFDFDCVIADDEAEKIYRKQGLEAYYEYEKIHAKDIHKEGPLADFFKKLAFFQKLESKKQQEDPNYQKILKTAIITTRNAPAHERVTNTLNNWGVTVDEMFLLGGIEKKRILEILKPHLFMDDRKTNLDPKLKNVPMVHIPFGVEFDEG